MLRRAKASKFKKIRGIYEAWLYHFGTFLYHFEALSYHFRVVSCNLWVASCNLWIASCHSGAESDPTRRDVDSSDVKKKRCTAKKELRRFSL